ncbi:MAG: fasciclin domain-containing protein [Phycisphaerae bacterium]
MKSATTVGLFAVAMFANTAVTWAGNCAASKARAMTVAGKMDIVDTAVSAGSFNTLVTAVKAAGLVDALKAPGPITVFAPTDEAFARLPKAALQNLLDNPDQLAAVLKQHVVAGRVMAADVVKISSAKTLLGQSVAVNTSNGVMIGNANVVKTDITASNGVIHVIDTVLLPANDIIETARSAGSFKTLLAAVEAAGLTDVLRGDGPFTVFAPTDAAFAKLPTGTVDNLLKDIPTLKSILTYHVAAGANYSKDVVGASQITVLGGRNLQVNTGDGVRVNDSKIVKVDVGATNGVIHVIDTVMIPGAGSNN